MKSIQTTVIALALAGQFSPSDRISAADATNNASIPSPEALRIVHGVCTQTMTNIYNNLIKLSGAFPILGGISKAHMESADPLIWSNATWEQHKLSYWKNVRTEQPKPSPNGRIPQKSEIQIVEKDGVKLEIYLDQHPVKLKRTHEYLLPYGTKGNELRLIYNLEVNPPDPALQKAVQDVIERNVALLRKSLPTS